MPISLPSNDEINFAQNSLNTLRSLLQNAKRASVGAEAEGAIRALNAQMNSTSLAVDAVRNFAPYNQRIDSITREFDRLARNGQSLSDDLRVGARYKGPRRGSMSAAEKTQYIAQNGQEAFLALPE